MTVAETTDLAERMDASLDELAPLHETLAASQKRLAIQLQELDEGPPDAEESGMEMAAGEWRAALGTLDEAYGRVWRRQLEGVAALWSDELIPRLEQVGQSPVRRLPEWVRLLLLGLAALLAGALLVILL